MDLLSVSPWGMLAAVIASVVVGYLWFSPFLFGKRWMTLGGISAKEMSAGPHPLTWGVMLLSEIGTAFLIAALRAMTGISTITETLTLGVLLFVCVYMLPTLTNVMFGRRNRMLWLIEAGYVFATIVVQAVIISSL